MDRTRRVMNEKHAAAGAMDSLHPKLLHSHRIHFSENNEASLVLPAAAFWKTARNLNLSSVRYFYYLWCRNGTFTGRDVLTNRTQYKGQNENSKRGKRGKIAIMQWLRRESPNFGTGENRKFSVRISRRTSRIQSATGIFDGDPP